jgi:hypothetical protein
MSGIWRKLWCWQFLLEVPGEIRSMLSRGISLCTFQQMFGGIDPGSTEVRGKVVSVSHHVMISYVKVVFDIPPFVIGEQVTEW